MSKSLIIRVPGRVHLTLFDLTGRGYRRHGGVGFATQLGYRCFAEANAVMRIVDNRPPSNENGAQVQAIQDLISKIASSEGLRPIHFEILEGFGAHQGFGSGTALRLAAIEALFSLSERKVSDDVLVKLSRRGGVSGVGVNSYFTGGIVLDVGVRTTFQEEFKSSDDYESVSDQPLKLLQLKMPSWRVGVCLPTVGGTTRDQERAFFLDATRDGTLSECGAIAFQALFGLLPAVVESDFQTFVESLDALQGTRWKAREREIHREKLHDVEQYIRERGGRGLALSSLGPAIVYFFEDCDAESSPLTWPGFEFATTVANNSGRQVDHA